jgi:hypothetical protein
MHKIDVAGGAVKEGPPVAEQPPSPGTISDETEIPGEQSHPVQFRLTGPGPITVHSVPTPHPQHSEKGVLGWLTIMRPGGGQPAARAVAHLTDAYLGATYNATDADAALTGNWTAEISNGALEAATWATSIRGNVTLPPSRPFLTASFDVELFNLIVAEVVGVASVSLHLTSDSGQQQLSTMTWSAALAARLGKPSVAFHVDDPQSSVGIPGTGDSIPLSFHIAHLDTDPAGTTVILGGTEPSLQATLTFQPDQILQGTDGTPDISIHSLTLVLEIGFDGVLNATCTAGASTLDGLLDESDKVASAMTSQVNAQLQATGGDFAKYTDQTAVKSNIETFFARLMHLPRGAVIKQFRYDGGSLLVDYYPPPIDESVAVHAVHEAVGAH